jgi:hypothetical protein
VGSHVRIVGRYVQDTFHGQWNEIHPVTSITAIRKFNNIALSCQDLPTLSATSRMVAYSEAIVGTDFPSGKLESCGEIRLSPVTGTVGPGLTSSHYNL